MDMRTDVNAVPLAGLGFHFLRKPVGNQRNLGSSNGEVAKRKRKERRSRGEQVDGGSCTSAESELKPETYHEVLGLASRHSNGKGK